MDRTTDHQSQGSKLLPSSSSSGLIPPRPRDSASAKLKWNMVLQHTTAAAAAAAAASSSSASLSRSTSKQALVDSRTPSPLITARDNGSQPTITDSANFTQLPPTAQEKKTSVDSTGSSSGSTATTDSLRSSMGFDWKVIGAPSMMSDMDAPGMPVPGHSRERALSLLERVSGAHLTDDYGGGEYQTDSSPLVAPVGASFSARTTRGYSVFSPFGESGFDFTPSQSNMFDGGDYQQHSMLSSFPPNHESQHPQHEHHRSAPSSRASSPAINHMPYYQQQQQPALHHQQQQQQHPSMYNQQPPYPFYAPQPTMSANGAVPLQHQHQLMQQQQYMQQQYYHSQQQQQHQQETMMMRRQSMMDAPRNQPEVHTNPPPAYPSRHRPSLSHGSTTSMPDGGYSMMMAPRNSVSGGPLPMRSSFVPGNVTSPPPMNSTTAGNSSSSLHSRRSSVPHRQQALHQMDGDVGYYDYHPHHQNNYQQYHPQPPYQQPPYYEHHQAYNYYQQPSPSTFVPSTSTPPPSTNVVANVAGSPPPVQVPQENNVAPQPSKPLQLSSYRGPMYAVEFKAGRTEVFYVVEGAGIAKLSVGDWVIVDADRGEDLGKVTRTISVDRLKQLMSMTADASHPDDIDRAAEQVEPELAPILYAKEIVPKPIHRLASPSDLKALQAKAQEEAIAMVRCQSRIRQKRLPMEVVDAEYQWDRNKLTFFYQSDKRIDFRELVRDLFRIYKTRIWMCAVDKNRLAALTEMRKSMDMEAVHAAAMAADAALGSSD